MANIALLIVVPVSQSERYKSNLSRNSNFSLHIVSTERDALNLIEQGEPHIDIVVVDNQMPDTHNFVRTVRQKYPRLLIIQVDESADFGLPGMADALITNPFDDNALAEHIRRMISERRMETQRSDSLPAVRMIAKNMKRAVNPVGKQEAATESILEMGYDYVAYYNLADSAAKTLKRTAHHGPRAILSIAPEEASHDDLVGWVAHHQQSRVAAYKDTPNHPLVERGRLGQVACVPVSFNGQTFGVIAACRDQPGTITQENVLMLELVATQLATALG